MPVFSKLTGDLSKIMGTMTENLREPMYAVRETAIKSGEPMLERMGHTIGKMMGGHFGKLPSSNLQKEGQCDCKAYSISAFDCCGFLMNL